MADSRAISREIIRLGVRQDLGSYADESNFYFYEPKGVTVVIAPWNFPFAISVGMAAAAIVAGNPVVYKPSGQSSIVGHHLVEIFREAGLPAGVFNYLPGRGSVIGDYLDRHTSRGDYVLAVPQLQMLYFFYDRRNPTAYAHYRRALEPEEEDRYIEAIRSHQTEYIFFTEPFEGARLGQTKQSFSEYAKRVRDWILNNYVVIESLGSVKILRRKT